VAGNPLRWVDPQGLQVAPAIPWNPGAGALGGGGAGGFGLLGPLRPLTPGQWDQMKDDLGRLLNPGPLLSEIKDAFRQVPWSAVDDRSDVPPARPADPDKAHCTRLYERCVQERWGGDWTCGQCHYYCTGINKVWPFEHCSPDKCR
jgi:hypothetical protein